LRESRSPGELLVDSASELTPTIPEMTALVGGMRVPIANVGHAAHGVLTELRRILMTELSVNLLDMSTKWTKSASADAVYEGRDCHTGALKCTVTPIDLLFGSNGELRAVADVYAESDGLEKVARDFVKAWSNVMSLDRVDLR
jgi:catalase-peroxidase